MDSRSFKIGIQLHIKISDKKLFCRCSEKYTNTDQVYSLTTYDPKKNRLSCNKYYYDIRNCEYELQNSLPLVPLKQHFSIAKSVAKDLGFEILNQYMVQRKHILDGSLPVGFQRTGLIGINGQLNGIKLTQIRLEEDSCKKQYRGYNTVRLGVPLLEIVSEPIELNLQQLLKFKELLIQLAEIVRNYTTVRGIGTIRQDLNISVGIGKTELKGFQDINNLQTVVCKQISRVNGLKDRFYSYIVQENCIRLKLANSSAKQTIKQVLLHLLNCKVIQQGSTFFKFEIPLEYKHSIVLNVLNAFRQATFETVRKVNKLGESQFLRYRQTKQRYHSEPLLRVVNIQNISFKQPVQVKQYSTIYKEIYAQLKHERKQQLAKNLQKKYIEKRLSKPQLTHIIKSLNEGADYETVTSETALKPFCLQFIEQEDVTKYSNFNQFLYIINKKYRSHISDYLEFKTLLHQYWLNKTS